MTWKNNHMVLFSLVHLLNNVFIAALAKLNYLKKSTRKECLHNKLFLRVIILKLDYWHIIGQIIFGCHENYDIS